MSPTVAMAYTKGQHVTFLVSGFHFSWSPLPRSFEIRKRSPCQHPSLFSLPSVGQYPLRHILFFVFLFFFFLLYYLLLLLDFIFLTHLLSSPFLTSFNRITLLSICTLQSLYLITCPHILVIYSF